MKNIILLSLIILFAGCVQTKPDRELRKLYLKEHVKNINYLTYVHFSHFEQYRVVNKENNNYEKIAHVIDACHELHDYLNEELYIKLDSGLIQKDWNQAIEKQEKIIQQIDSVPSPFLLRIMQRYALEKIQPCDSDELKVAKYFSNCQHFVHVVYNAVEYTKNYHERKFNDLFSLITINDTIKLGDTLQTTGGICLQEDMRGAIIIQQMRDCKLTSIDFKTGKFILETTGSEAYIRFAYYDSFRKEDVTHEINF